MPAMPLGLLKYFVGMKMMNGMMKMNGDMAPMGMEMSNQQMDMNNVMYPETTGEEYGRSKSKLDEIVNLDSALAAPEPVKTDSSKTASQSQGHDMHNMGGMSMEMSDDLVTLNYAMLKSP